VVGKLVSEQAVMTTNGAPTTKHLNDYTAIVRARDAACRPPTLARPPPPRILSCVVSRRLPPCRNRFRRLHRRRLFFSRGARRRSRKPFIVRVVVVVLFFSCSSSPESFLLPARGCTLGDVFFLEGAMSHRALASSPRSSLSRAMMEGRLVMVRRACCRNPNNPNGQENCLRNVREGA
jgi:hypothetical protein